MTLGRVIKEVWTDPRFTDQVRWPAHLSVMGQHLSARCFAGGRWRYAAASLEDIPTDETRSLVVAVDRRIADLARTLDPLWWDRDEEPAWNWPQR